MTSLRKFTVSVTTIILSALVGFWVMMWGWGLTPKSWSVIIWGVVLQFCVFLFQTIGTSED